MAIRTVYIADDDTEFDSLEEAEQYEKDAQDVRKAIVGFDKSGTKVEDLYKSFFILFLTRDLRVRNNALEFIRDEGFNVECEDKICKVLWYDEHKERWVNGDEPLSRAFSFINAIQNIQAFYRNNCEEGEGFSILKEFADFARREEGDK